MEETQIPKSCHAENTERKEKKTSPLNEFKLQGMVSLVKKKRLVHEERDNY